MAAGGDVRAGVREALPGWSRVKARIKAGRGRVKIRLRPPSPLRLLSEKLEVTAEAAVNAP
jgi:hypothetical protein